jgi:hypothetical protein
LTSEEARLQNATTGQAMTQETYKSEEILIQMSFLNYLNTQIRKHSKQWAHTYTAYLQKLELKAYNR